jgi:hypothetical protein
LADEGSELFNRGGRQVGFDPRALVLGGHLRVRGVPVRRRDGLRVLRIADGGDVPPSIEIGRSGPHDCAGQRHIPARAQLRMAADLELRILVGHARRRVLRRRIAAFRVKPARAA